MRLLDQAVVRFRIFRSFGAPWAVRAGQSDMSSKSDTPRWVAAALSHPWLLTITRVALTSAFWVGGIQKLGNFSAAIAEQAHFGLRPAWLWAAAAIIVELGGSALVIFDRWTWFGAGGLGVLTAVAMLAANNFWALTGHGRFLVLNAFFEHLGLIAGLFVVSCIAAQPPDTQLSTPFHSIEATHD
jgi:uncharacterized membrane protein YphA (DoxX/SURF4 family)